MAFWNKKDDELGSTPGDSKDSLGINPPSGDPLAPPSLKNEPSAPSSPPPLSNPDIEPSSTKSQEPFGMSPPAEMSAPPQNQNPNNIEKDLSLINAKLDAIKAELAHVHHRIQNIESIANESQKSPETKKPTQQYRW